MRGTRSWFFLGICLLFAFGRFGDLNAQYFHFSTAREKGLAGISTVLTDQPASGLFNPANLAALRRPVFSIHAPEFFRYSQIAVANFYPDIGALGFGFGRLPDQSETDYVHFAYSQALSDAFRAGAATQVFFRQGQTEIEANLGFSLRPANVGNTGSGSSRLALGMALQNVSFGGRRLGPPLRFRIGILYQILPDLFNLAGEMQFQKSNNAFRLGAELHSSEYLILRTGMSNFDQNYWFGGLGFQLGTLRLDLAYDRFQEKIEFACTIEFGEVPEEKAKRLFEAGERLVRERKFSAAVKNFRAATFFHPANSDYRDRYEQLELLLQKLKSSEERALAEASRYEQEGQYLGAYLRYYDLVKQFPENEIGKQKLVVLRNLARAQLPSVIPNIEHLQAANQLPEAEKAVRRLLTIAPDDTLLQRMAEEIGDAIKEQFEDHYYRGLGYLSQRNFSAAREAFSQALKLRPDDLQTQRNLREAEAELEKRNRAVDSLLAIARSLEQSGKYRKAIHEYGAILELDPEHEYAIQALDRLRPRVQEQIQTLLNQSRTELARGNFSRAERLCREVLRLRPEGDQATKLLTEIRRRRLQEADAYFARGQEYFSQKKFQEAIAAFKAAMRLNPGSTVYPKKLKLAETELEKQEKWLLANQQLTENRFQEAEKAIQELLKSDPENKTYQEFLEKLNVQRNRLVTFLLQQGIKLYSEEKYEEAIATFQQLLGYDPNHQTARDYQKRIEAKLRALKKLKQ